MTKHRGIHPNVAPLTTISFLWTNKQTNN